MKLATKMESIISWLRGQFKKCDYDNYFWTNLGKKADEKDIETLRRWLGRKLPPNGFAFAINGICPLRPQRTGVGLPEWIRNAGPEHSEWPQESCFVFVSKFRDGSEKALLDDAKEKAERNGARLYVFGEEGK